MTPGPSLYERFALTPTANVVAGPHARIGMVMTTTLGIVTIRKTVEGVVTDEEVVFDRAETNPSLYALRLLRIWRGEPAECFDDRALAA